jgi:hypothetical protein
VSKKKILDAQSLSKLRVFLNRSTNEELLGSSFYEFAPWYRYNYGFLLLCHLTGIPISFRDVLRSLKSSFSNLCFQSRIQLSPSTKVATSSEIIFTWLIGEHESRQDCLSRYYGSFANEPSVNQAHVWGIATCPISKEAILRLNSEGVSLIWKTRPSILDLSGALRKVVCGLNPLLLFDAEYWTGRQISTKFLEWLETSKMTHPRILLAYEQQPWQLALIAGVKQVYQDKVDFIGDVHTSLTNFPSQFIKTRITPDQLIVHGNAYKRVLIQHCGWPEARIKITPSRRFIKKLIFSTSQIVLPYVMASHHSICEALKKISAANPNMARWHVRPHPARISDSKYAELVKAIQLLVDQVNLKLNPTGEIVILVCGVSTLILEALESGYAVYNVLENPNTDGLSPDIWDGLTVESLSQNLTKYHLKHAGEFVIYG